MGDYCGLPIDSLQFPQRCEHTPRLRRCYHVKRDRSRTQNRSEYSSCEIFDGDQMSEEMEEQQTDDLLCRQESIHKKQTSLLNRSRSTEEVTGHKEVEIVLKITKETDNRERERETGAALSILDTDREEWWEDFDLLLHHPVGLRLFTEFLTKEFSEENIVFWKACQHYKEIPDGRARVQKAQEIFNQHLALEAPEPVNVDSGARQAASEAVTAAVSSRFGQPGIFQTSQKQIYNLMKMDSFHRFLQSSIYREYMDKRRDGSQGDLDGKLQVKNKKQELKKWSLSALSSIIGRSKSKERESQYPGLPTRTFSSPDIALLAQTCPDIQFIRILLPDRSTAILSPQPGQTIQDIVQTLLRRRGEKGEVRAYLDNGEHLDMQQSSSIIGERSVVLEWA